MYKKSNLLFIFLVLLSAFIIVKKEKPTLYLIGDSTVRNGTYGRGDGGLWGWGSFIQNLFDTNKINIANKAFGGTSSRSFFTKGFWAKVDNDGNPTTLRGITDDSAKLFNPISKDSETVHSFGWNIRKYIRETKAKGGIPIVLSLVPRNIWKDGKINRVAAEYVQWDSAVAAQENVDFINLNKIIADHYDEMGEVDAACAARTITLHYI